MLPRAHNPKPLPLDQKLNTTSADGTVVLFENAIPSSARVIPPPCSPGLLAMPQQLKPRTGELGQWLRFEGELEARLALSWTAGLLAVRLYLMDIIKLPLIFETHECRPKGSERDKR